MEITHKILIFSLVLGCSCVKKVEDVHHPHQLWSELHPFASLEIYDVKFSQEEMKYIIKAGLIPVDRKDLWEIVSTKYNGVLISSPGFWRLKINEELDFHGYNVVDFSWEGVPDLSNNEILKFNFVLEPYPEERSYVGNWDENNDLVMNVSFPARFNKIEFSWPIYLSSVLVKGSEELRGSQEPTPTGQPERTD